MLRLYGVCYNVRADVCSGRMRNRCTATQATSTTIVYIQPRTVREKLFAENPVKRSHLQSMLLRYESERASGATHPQSVLIQKFSYRALSPLLTESTANDVRFNL